MSNTINKFILGVSKLSIPIPKPKDLNDEKNEITPYLVFNIYDAQGNEVRKLTKKAKKGINRVNWDLRYLWPRPIKPLKEFKPDKKIKGGILVVPGTYQVKMGIVHKGIQKELVSKQSFEIKRLNNTTLPADDEVALALFLEKIKEIARITWGTQSLHTELSNKVNSLEQMAIQTTNLPVELKDKLVKIRKELQSIKWQLN